MWLLVGLGNPGPEYELHRHNVGFLLIDQFLELNGRGFFKNDFKSLVATKKIFASDIVLLKPQTYMNLSGEAVRLAMDYYKIPLTNLIVVHDDIDQPFGGIRIHHSRGHGGHNGIRDITDKLGTNEYIRIKIGVDRPVGHQPVADYVLQNFSKEQMKKLHLIGEEVNKAIEAIIKVGHNKAATQFNRIISLD